MIFSFIFVIDFGFHRRNPPKHYYNENVFISITSFKDWLDFHVGIILYTSEIRKHFLNILSTFSEKCET